MSGSQQPLTLPATFADSTRALRLTMVASILVPVLMFVAVALYDHERIMEDAIHELERTTAILHEHAENVFSFADMAIRQASLAADGLDWRQIAASRKLHDFIAATNEHARVLSAIVFIDPEGRLAQHSRVFPVEPLRLDDRAYFRPLVDGSSDLEISEAVNGRVSGQTVFALARAHTPGPGPGQQRGVAVASIRVDTFLSIYREAAPQLNHSVALVKSDGTFIVRDSQLPPPADVRPAASHYFMRAIEGNDQGVFEGVSAVDGVRRIVAFRKVAAYPLYVALAVGTDAILAEWWTNMALYGALCLGAAVSLFLTAALALRRTAAERVALMNWQTEVERREQAEKALREAQKMEAVGQLSGGIAHDFNNLLQALSGCLIMIERRASQPSIQPLLEAGRQAVDRGAKLTRQLMAFARREALRPEPVDVRDRLLTMSELLSGALRANIRLEVRLEPGLWPAEVDPTQLELAVLNLAINARDAMPDGGLLTIEAANTHLQPGSDHGGLRGEFVRLTITDTGIGMSEDVAVRAFEPFFTTKEKARGTGLGLSQVYGFARQSGGVARIDSAPGKGTAVTLLLPRCTKPVLPPVRPVEHDAPATVRHVLLVEDDPIVAAVMAAAVVELGYQVSRASSAEEALAILSDGEPVDLLFTDVVMPGEMSGLDLARKVRRTRPDLPVLVTTGYSEEIAQGSGFHILPKPYDMRTLAEAVSAVLSRVTQGNA
ncbi:ATP-binding protein [Azospirillum oleiclasticum]|nr:ATP-binding protein [Azospirillum oleiclasticum]